MNDFDHESVGVPVQDTFHLSEKPCTLPYLIVPYRMADPSKVVLRWEIDNATARFETGKVESEVFTEGGFKW